MLMIKDIQFDVNVQHDCRNGKCEATGTKVVRQERTNTTRTIKIIEHANDTHFILNTNSIHHAEMLRRVLPRDLTKPRRLQAPNTRRAFHNEVAARLRISQDAKRAKTQQARAAKQQQKKAGGSAGRPQRSVTMGVDGNTPISTPPTNRPPSSKRTTDAWSEDELEAEPPDYGTDENGENDDIDEPVTIRSRNSRRIKKPRLWVP